MPTPGILRGNGASSQVQIMVSSFRLKSWSNAPATRDVALEHALLSAWTKLTCIMSGASPASYTSDTTLWITLAGWRTLFMRPGQLHKNPWKYCGIIVKSLSPSGITVLVMPCCGSCMHSHDSSLKARQPVCQPRKPPANSTHKPAFIVSRP